MKRPNQDKGVPEKGQVRASEIIRHVMEARDLYRLPDGVEVFYDVPEGVNFEHAGWVTLSKSAFAAKWGCAPQQVSRWIKAGLPVREDGRLEYHACNEWVGNYKEENEIRQASGWRD